jgi:hypothetical protein
MQSEVLCIWCGIRAVVKGTHLAEVGDQSCPKVATPGILGALCPQRQRLENKRHQGARQLHHNVLRHSKLDVGVEFTVLRAAGGSHARRFEQNRATVYGLPLGPQPSQGARCVTASYLQVVLTRGHSDKHTLCTLSSHVACDDLLRAFDNQGMVTLWCEITRARSPCGVR